LTFDQYEWVQWRQSCLVLMTLCEQSVWLTSRKIPQRGREAEGDFNEDPHSGFPIRSLQRAETWSGPHVKCPLLFDLNQNGNVLTHFNNDLQKKMERPIIG
jgi:hypothetical protein